jgi:hypothetical protein
MVHDAKDQKEIKDVQYKFRVSETEKRLLDAVGTPVQWRAFITTIAMVVKAIQEGDIDVKIENLDFASLFKKVFTDTSGMQDVVMKYLKESLEGDK